MEQIIRIRSPHSGKLVVRLSEHLFTDGTLVYPFIDHILYLRNKPEFRDSAVEFIYQNKIEEARALLLRDQDAFSINSAPPVAEIIKQLKKPARSLSDMMQFLNYGGVADYFSARWSSPTFVAGLALLQNILEKERIHVEIACGIGQFLKIAENNGIQTIGIDVVFSKLWLAHKCLGINGILICADITEKYGYEVLAPVSIHCQDALYFLEEKKQVLHTLRNFSEDTHIGIGHCHTDQECQYSNGFPLSLKEYKTVAEEKAKWFTDQTLIQAWLHDTLLTHSDTAETLAKAKAVSWIEGTTTDALFELRPPEEIRINPLIDSNNLSKIHWPSDSYKQEYQADYGYFLNRLENLTTKEAIFLHKEINYKNRVLIEDTRS